MARSIQVLDTLRRHVDGELITPDQDEQYELARLVEAGIADLRPSAIVQAASVADVQAVVAVARDSGTELAVRGHGHSAAGHGTVENGIVLDMSALSPLEIDPRSRTARVGAGLSAGALTQETGRHGLAVPLGDTTAVGVAGITLGGGVGPLARTYGMAIDSLLGAELVTADGRVRTVDADHDPDLFWAIRGGGGNFGVATSLTFRLHDVARTVGGTLVLPAEPAVLASLLAEAHAAPRERTTILMIWRCPPLPVMPTELHGRLVVFAHLVHVGSEGAERALAPFRRLGPPLADLITEAPYAGMLASQEIPRLTSEVRTQFFDHVDEDVAAAMIDGVASAPTPMSMLQLRVLGGAVGDVPDEATAYGFRDRTMVSYLACAYEGAEQQRPTAAWADRVVASLDQGLDGAFLNFLGPADPATVASAYPAPTWQRLRRIKATYDPGNVFRRNHNIPPAPPNDGPT